MIESLIGRKLYVTKTPDNKWWVVKDGVLAAECSCRKEALKKGKKIKHEMEVTRAT